MYQLSSHTLPIFSRFPFSSSTVAPEEEKNIFHRVVSLPKRKYPEVMIKVKTRKPCLKSIFLSDSPFFPAILNHPFDNSNTAKLKSSKKHTESQIGLDKRKKDNAPPVMPHNHYSRLPRVWVNPSLHVIWAMWSAGPYPWTVHGARGACPATLSHWQQQGEQRSKHSSPWSKSAGFWSLRTLPNPSILCFLGFHACFVWSVRHHCVEGFGCWN